jgi:hypothetical protein
VLIRRFWFKRARIKATSRVLGKHFLQIREKIVVNERSAEATAMGGGRKPLALARVHRRSPTLLH